MKMTMTATGDSLLVQGYPEGGYPGFSEVKEFIEKGQARFGNLETCITERDTYCSAYCGGTWINAEPRILDQILSYGMNFMGFANNHTMDFGPDGMLETVENVKKRGVALAGAGKDLAEAAAPVYRTFAGGRVAFIDICSTVENAARAGYASKTIKGRPGLNPLRFNSYTMLNQEHFAMIREIIANTKINGLLDCATADGFVPPLPEDILYFGYETVRLAKDGKEEKFTSCNKHDLARTLDAIKDAQYIADYVVVMLHSHEIKANDMSEPDDFAIEFAHACIDAGACAIIGNGTHQLKPIELYKGKPIFYSLGNFCFQSNVLEYQPEDLREKFNLPPISDVQSLARRNREWTIGLHTQDINFISYIPYMEFEGGELTHLELKPIELGFKNSRTFKGIPYPANEQDSVRIFERLRELSAPYGTKMQLEQGIIHIDLAE